jgi:catechol 2,3-dioxygenase-like lactoylglutathione lyase family enzyme
MKQVAGFGVLMGLVAVAAVAAEPPARAVAYDNVHIRVLDPAKAAEWYVRALGAQPSEPPAPGTAQVTFGSNVITIIKGDKVQPSAGTLIDHIGLSYRDVDAAVTKAEAAGAKVTSPPRESPGIFRYAYIEDPWGVRIEMVQDAERLGFHHVHLRVKDPDATLTWYQQQFGGERTKLKGKVDGVRFNGVWLFAMSSEADLPAPVAAIQLVAFRVDDVDAGMKGLAASGVKAAAEPRSLPALRYAFVEDPNGIRVELVKRTTTP